MLLDGQQPDFHEPKLLGWAYGWGWGLLCLKGWGQSWRAEAACGVGPLFFFLWGGGWTEGL